MAASGLFRLTSTFEQGFKKEDVLAYVDDLTNKNADLQKEKKALEEALEAGGGVVGGGVDKAIVDKLEEEKRTLKEQLEEVNIQLEKQESLLAGEKSVREKMQKQFTEEKQRLMGELAQASSFSGESEGLMEQIKEKDEEIENLVDKVKKLEAEISEKSNEAVQKDKEIENLKAQVTELKENSNSDAQGISAIQQVYIEAQNTVKKLTVDAQQKYDERIAEAEKEAEKILDEANKKVAESEKNAEKIIADADKKAEEIVANAEKTAFEKCKYANEMGDAVISTTDEIKKLVISDVDSISGDIKNLMDMFRQLSSDVNAKINETTKKLENAKNTISDDKLLNECIGKINAEKENASTAMNSIEKTAESEKNTAEKDNNAVTEDSKEEKKEADVIPVAEDITEETLLNFINPEEPEDREDIKENVPPVSSKKKKSKTEPKIANNKISTADWGIDLDALTKQIEEDESKKEKLEEE